MVVGYLLPLLLLRVLTPVSTTAIVAIGETYTSQWPPSRTALAIASLICLLVAILRLDDIAVQSRLRASASGSTLTLASRV